MTTFTDQLSAALFKAITLKYNENHDELGRFSESDSGGGDSGGKNNQYTAPHISQNDMEILKDKLERGLITPDQANVEKVRIQRVLVASHIPKSVRSALNSAVKTGYLSHKGKDGLKPEVYYHPNFEYLANEARDSYVRNTINALSKVTGLDKKLL